MACPGECSGLRRFPVDLLVSAPPPHAAVHVGLVGAQDLSQVGSLTWFDRRADEPVAVVNAPLHPVQLDAAPPPDFDGLPFDKYFSPELVLPYDINRGCYYGECTFCTLPTVIGVGASAAS